MRTQIKGWAARRCTRANAKWFLRATAASWVIQGAVVGVLAVCGVGALSALISAKVASWVVFLGQCLKTAK